MANSKHKPEVLQAAVDAVAAHGTISAAGRALGIPAGTFQHRVEAARRQGYEPQVQALMAGENAAPPEGYKLKGTSTLYGEDGRAKLQWVKTDAKLEELRALQKAAFDAMCKELPPLAPIKGPKTSDADLCNLYTITDAHLGQLSQAQESGDDWDLKIAERTIGGCFEYLIQNSPAAHTGFVNNGGDFLHTDSFKPLTPASGHMLDADSRYQKIVQVSVRVLRRMIDAALEKHTKVVVNMLDANHDPVGETWLRVMFAALYESNPRVTVTQSPNPYTAYQHGQTMLAFHHGHGTKKTNLPLLFATRFPEMWGQTSYRYCHTGHYHHTDEREHPGMTVTQHPTLAAPDAYASRGGYDSNRVAQAIFYHVKYGQVGRTFVSPEMLRP